MIGFTDDRHARFIPASVYGPGAGTIWLDDIKCFGNETDISDCQHSEWGKSDCNHDEDISVDCQTPTRLFGGNAHKGRVEVQIDGEWNSLCKDTFRTAEAKVVCSMLGFSASGAELYTSSSSQSMVSTTSYVCKGEEQDLSMCNMVETNCSSRISAGINCKTPIRLANGTGPHSGRVELKYRGQWGTICDDNFDDMEAKVICNMLGFSGKNAKAHFGAYYGEGQGNIVVDELRCVGTEEDISECKSSDWLSQTDCNHNEDAAVECFSELRLQDGPADFVGRLEILNGTNWETVCSDGVDNHTALVICNTLGFQRGNISVYTDGRYGNGTLKQNGYQCVGNETDIANCKYTDIADSCTSDIGINCFSRSPVRIKGGQTFMSGLVEVYLNGQWYAYRRYSFVTPGRCIGSLGCHGNETDITECIPTSGMWYTGSCNSVYEYVGINCGRNTMYRLTDGNSIKSGRVEALYNGTWFGICTNSNFTTFEANMICNKIGFTQSGYVLSPSYTMKSPSINGLICDGNEKDLSDCNSNTWGQEMSCSNVQISCNSTVRLLNGTSERSGRVEVFHQGEWGTICADDFDNDDADVVCRKAGIRLWNASVLTGSTFGRGNLSNIINSTNCTGQEWDLSACKSSPWQESSCNGTDVASVNCKVLNSEIRLVGGTTNFDGEVEIKYKNIWRKIGSFYDKTTVDGICSFLGFNFSSDAAYTNTRHYGDSYLFRNLQCRGDESDISLCRSSDWGLNYVSEDSYSAGVNCLSPIQLDGGLTKYMGYVKLTKDGCTSYLCAEDLTAENEVVMCNMLGYSFATQHVISSIDVLKPSFSTPVYIQNITCAGNEQDYQMCQLADFQSSELSCASGKNAFVRCNTPVRLAEMTDKVTGIPEVYQNGTWNRMCYSDRKITNINNAQVLCFMMGFSSSSVSTWNASGSDNIEKMSVTCRSGLEDDISTCSTDNLTCAEVLSISCPTHLELQHGRTKYMGQISAVIGRGKDYIYNVDSAITIATTRINSTWYPVCFDGFDENAAFVICRMAGHYHTRDATFSYKESNDSSVLGKWQCTGDEVDISRCVSYNESVGSCSSRKIIQVDCRALVRIIDGPSPTKGRVEVFYGGHWGPVCSSSVLSNMTNIICSSAGYRYTYGTIKSANTYTNKTFDNYTVTNLNCTGYEDEITECKSDEWTVGSCGNNYPLEVECKTDVQLVSGVNKFFGRIQLTFRDIYGDKYGSVCAEHFDSNDADTICGLVGAPTKGSALIFANNKYGMNGGYAIENLECIGNEEDIQECKSLPWFSENKTCHSSNSSVSINCRPYTPIRLTGGTNSSGVVEAWFDRSWIRICSSDFSYNEAAVICRRLNYTVGEPGIHYYGTGYIYGLQCKGTETDISQYNRVRLRDGINKYQGRVEFQYNGVWGTVCSKYFDKYDAQVICRLASAPGNQTAIIHDRSKYGIGSGSLVVEDLNCTGTEDNLDECGSFPWLEGSASPSCNSHYYDVGVNCRPNTPIRLVNGTNATKYLGRVEIEYDGKWGPICDRSFDANNAKVICRMLGLNTESAIYHGNAFYGTGNTGAIISNLNCHGHEQDISECGADTWSEIHGYCSAVNNVAVQCNTPVRVNNAWTLYLGVVEVYIRGSWRRVCFDNFTDADAETICNIAGLRHNYTGNATFYDASRFGFSHSYTSLGGFNCTGDEDDLFLCGNGEWVEENFDCPSGINVAVNCRADTPIALKRDEHAKHDLIKGDHGLVEIQYQKYQDGKYQPHWGTICDDNFGDNDALVLCSMMGYDYGTLDRNPDIMEDYKPGDILIDELECIGSENDVSECPASQWSTHDCNHDEDVYIKCVNSSYIDPCSNDVYKRLPSLEMRVLSFKATTKPVDDSKLSPGWYSVGNNILLNEEPPLNRCGTYFPIFTQGDPIFKGVVKAIVNGFPNAYFGVKVQQCSFGFVYKLKPTPVPQSAYCFGIGSEDCNDPDQFSEKFDKHRTSIRLDYKLQSGENLDSAKTYNAYSEELTVKLEARFRQEVGVGLEKVVIVSLSEPSERSLIIEFVLVTSKDDFVEKALSIALVELSQTASFEIFGSTAKVLRVGVGDQDGTSLIVLIVSTSAGILLLLLILVLVVVVCKRQNKKRDNQPVRSLEPKHKDNVYRDMHDIALQKQMQELETKIPRLKLSGSQLAFENGTKDSTHFYEGTVYTRSADDDGYEYLPVDDHGSYYNEGFRN
ncbi:scavenger receptor cysteine-rich type 1 protein M160-like [Mya arenaria]|uniref:scavenger receptor cysteine-rich type 1 protein M160-like n=1 Tax=Mya arenaria TaxID=6604 RepID=UPI0022E748E8|nr:scavenger receptor cysteine-rich type 1 protein M160-like [Mya arenaria]